MRLKVLASSSKGNCYILQSPTGSLIIEAGIPWKEIQIGLCFDLSHVNACLVSHAHKDHAKAVEDVMRAGIDCYMSRGTFDTLNIRADYYRAISAGIEVQTSFGDFTVKSFRTEHDCVDPRGFLIQYRPTGEKLLFLTDSYYSRYRFPGLKYIMIECNYCKDILERNIEAGLVDEGMKRRLLESHFSLEHVKDFLMANDLSQCQEIILLHLSEGNSDPTKMIREIEEVTGIRPRVASPGLVVDLEQYPY